MNYPTVNSSLSISSIFCIVTFIIVTTGVSDGCFITNCPPGGKRSGAEVKIRQCEQCGPPGSMGRCYGPTICCSPEFGCLFATPETFPCLIENRFTTLCQNPGASCSGQGGELNGGQCAAENVCCNSETCTMDDTCHEDTGAVQSLSAHTLLASAAGGKEGGIVKGGQQHPLRHPLDIVLHRFINGQRLSHGLAARLPSSSANQPSSSSSLDY